MGIDGIGKPPGANIGGVPGAAGAAPAPPAESFSVDRGAPSSSSEAGSRVSAALMSVQRGELSVDQYLDGRVSDATSHLVGKLSPDQMEFVRQSLREQLATDPVLVELVRRTTGTAAASELR
jgi:hypothetical protein